MSYTFASPDVMTGTLGTTYAGETLTIAAWVKHPTYTNFQCVAAIGTSASADQESLTIEAGDSANVYRVYSYAGGSNSSASVTQAIGSTWTPIVAVLAADNDRRIYAGTVSNVSTTNTSSRVIDDVVQYLSVGAQLDGGGKWGGSIAEVAFWRKGLSAAEVEDYMGGLAASAIAASDLIAYFPLLDNTDKSAGIDSITSLTNSGASAASGDHPTISSGLTKYLKLLAESAAASATGVEVVVHSAPSGSNYVTGTTRYGSASGQAFEASLESGQAVLKVLASDVGCSALAVDTVVSACARNTTYTTGMVSATIIEE